MEDLAIGDLLPTAFGDVRPIEWIARYQIARSDPTKPWPKKARPVRIARSALAPNVPETDLFITQAHCLLFDGVLVPSGRLVNKNTITIDEAAASIELEFFHIKLETHDVIYAEGAPVETLLEVDESAVNFVDYFRTHGFPADRSRPAFRFWATGGETTVQKRASVMQRLGSGLESKSVRFAGASRNEGQRSLASWS